MSHPYDLDSGYAEIYYPITYNPNNATSGSAPPSQEKTHGVNLTLRTNSGNLARTGYTFAGWNTQANGSGTDYAAGGTYTANASVTLYAKWTPITYNVSYNANGATSGSAPADQTKTHGVNLTLRTNFGNLARTGYTFAGWNTQANGSGTDYAAGGTYTANASVTLYAKWTPITYNVNYNANGATSGSAPADQTKTHGVNLTLRTNSGNLARTGYTFAGWNTQTNGSGTDYAAGGTYTANASVTLYAKWTPITYNVSYNANGATSGSAPADQTKTHGVNLTLRTNSGNLARTGYTFAGWNTQANGSGTDYAAGGTYTTNASVTLYAKWTQDAATYTVSYNANGATSGSAPADQTKIHGVNLTLRTNSGNLQRTGYTFAGWNTQSNGSGTDYAAGGTYTANASVTLFAKWTPNTYTVSYNANGATSGSVPSFQTKTHDENLTLRTNSGNLQRTGYTFAGWNTQANGSGTDYASGGAYTANASVTLFAKWTQDAATYTVSYNANGATSGFAPDSQTKTHGVNLTLRTNSGNLARTGYTFAGWNTQANGGGTDYAVGGTYTANAPLTLFAKWTSIGCTLGEALNEPDLTWTTGGHADWFCQEDVTRDGLAAQSGAITHNQQSWMQTTVTGPGTISFWWKVSSENNYDFLRFYIGSAEHRISGNVDWQQRSYYVPSGAHTLKWQYDKDRGEDAGSDCGWVDQVSWSPGAGMSPSGGGSISDRRPQFSWPTVSGATWYRIWISRDGQTYMTDWVEGATMWTPPTRGLPVGYYRWAVQPWAANTGYGAWFQTADFRITGGAPGLLTLISPTGPQTTHDLTYRWTMDANATWYRLGVTRIGVGTWHDRWFQISGTGEASVNPGSWHPGVAEPVLTSPAGTISGNRPTFQWTGAKCSWQVRPWGPEGNGPLSGPVLFSIPYPAGTWFRVYVNRGNTTVYDDWTTSGSLLSPINLQSGAHSWWLGAWDRTTGRTIWSDPMDFMVP